MDTTQHFFNGEHALPGPHRQIGDGRSTAGAAEPLRLLVLPAGWALEVVKPVVLVGRHSDVELRLAYPDVSRRHCRLVFCGGLWHIHDLDSRNGVFVNGVRLHETALYTGDRIDLGTATLVVTAAPGPAPVAAGPEAEMLRSISDALRSPPLAG